MENSDRTMETSSRRHLAGQYSAASLAYLGDSVLEVMIRRRLVERQVRTPSVQALKYVTAPAQSEAVERLLPLLTEDEADAFKRGRNCVHSGVPKSATPAQYRRATGLECLFGYLHIANENARLQELFTAAYPELFG